MAVLFVLEKRKINILNTQDAPSMVEINIRELKNKLSFITLSDSLIEYPKVPGKPAMEARAIR
jgi:hypothetical protein